MDFLLIWDLIYPGDDSMWIYFFSCSIIAGFLGLFQFLSVLLHVLEITNKRFIFMTLFECPGFYTVRGYWVVVWFDRFSISFNFVILANIAYTPYAYGMRWSLSYKWKVSGPS